MTASSAPVLRGAGDATTEDGVVQAFDAAEALGPPHVVVHRAGGWEFPRITEITQESIDAALALNLRSAKAGVEAAAKVPARSRPWRDPPP